MFGLESVFVFDGGRVCVFGVMSVSVVCSLCVWSLLCFV